MCITTPDPVRTITTHNCQGPYTVTNCRSGLQDVASLDTALKMVANADDPDGRVFDANGTPVANNPTEAHRLWVAGRKVYGHPPR
jgi:hypothetical protein